MAWLVCVAGPLSSLADHAGPAMMGSRALGPCQEARCRCCDDGQDAPQPTCGYACPQKVDTRRMQPRTKSLTGLVPAGVQTALLMS